MATGEPLAGIGFRLHVAGQKGSFRGEAVGGTVREGVAGWEVRLCRGQRLKLAKFVFVKSLKIVSRFSK